MQKRGLVVCAAAAGAALSLLLTCSKSSNPTGPGGDSGIRTETYSYSLLGSNNIIISFPERIDYWSSCNGNVLIAYRDTTPAGIDTVFYYISNDSLYISGGVGNGGIFIRVGSGTGLAGQWSAAGTSQDGPDQLDIGAATVMVTFMECYGDDFMENDAPDITSTYTHVSVVQLACNSVRLTGSTTGEVVTITWDNDGNMTYSSSNSQHASKTVYENPTLCPNDPPTWYTPFLTGNSSPQPLVKKAVQAFTAVPPRAKKHSLFR